VYYKETAIETAGRKKKKRTHTTDTCPAWPVAGPVGSEIRFREKEKGRGKRKREGKREEREEEKRKKREKGRRKRK
jgi:hypothetical protein